ncbi:diguanylate cyclase [Gilvimarinus agarilyticus]|uniref:diguanylate cyclase n=1 Tax=Gilvimarinus agarilyticus TaxID=679259 RepID=UPI0005A0677A|nr:diguanylate cyclase [Gilvimarinus agarilyticus]
MIRLHKWKLLTVAFITNITIVISLAVGDVKNWGDIDWLDIVGEGGVCLLAALWLGFTLNSRPNGAVTNLLALGLGLIFVGTFQDLLDEIIAIDKGLFLNSGLESILMPTGLTVLTFGLYHWHKEQLVFSEQRRKREQVFREYRLQDGLTGLGDARFLRRQLSAALQRARHQQQPLALVLLDIDHFAATNQRFGHAEGDRLLQELAELILLNLRRTDLLCRYAGDRFAVVLPNTGELMAREITAQLSRAIEHFAYKTAQQGETVYQSISAGISIAEDDKVDALIERATTRLLQAKDKKNAHSVAA